MIVSRDQIAALNFGYLSGSDLLQFCPDQMLIKAYADDPNKLQTGCNQAYGYVKAKLINRYDLNQVLSNANQIFKKQTGSLQVTIAAGTYVSTINFSSIAPQFDSSPITGFPGGQFPIIDVFTNVKIGTILGGDDILPLKNIENGYLWFANKYFSTLTTLYFTITGPETTITISANTGVQMPTITPVTSLNKTGDFTLLIYANTYIYQIFANILLGTPSIKIGTTLGGEEIVPLTLVSNSILPIVSGTNYFATTTTLYISVVTGSVNLRFDEGLNFTAPTPQPFAIKDDLLIEILAIRAIKCILGANAGTSKQLESLIEENENIIEQIQTEMMGLTLPAPPRQVDSIPHVVQSSFKTIG